MTSFEKRRPMKYAKDGVFAVLCVSAVIARRTDLLIMAVFAWATTDLLLFLQRHGVTISEYAITDRELSGSDRKIFGVLGLIFAVAGIYFGAKKADLYIVLVSISLFGVGGLGFLLTEPKSPSTIIRSRYRIMRKLLAPKESQPPPKT